MITDISNDKRSLGQGVYSVAVVGGGTAGLLAALSIRQYNPDLQIDVIHSSRKGHIMVGEGTTYSVLDMLHNKMGLDRKEFTEQVAPTPKLGIRFLWGPRNTFDYTFEGNPFPGQYFEQKTPLGVMCAGDAPLIDYTPASAHMSLCRMPSAESPDFLSTMAPPAAYHFENHAFVEHLTRCCAARNIRFHDTEIEAVEQDDTGVSGLRCSNAQTYSADLYVDASGFASVLMKGALEEPVVDFKNHVFCDKAVVGGWDRSDDEPLKPYTTAETMDAGWCWQIEHRNRINRGYVFCSDFISDDDAQMELRRKNPKIGETRVIPFAARRSRRAWVKNVVAIGNANGFVEPLEATNIHIISEFSVRLAEMLSLTRQPPDRMVHGFNEYVESRWQMIAEFLAVHYRFNTKLNTPFWEFVRRETDLGQAQAVVDYFRAVGPDSAGLRHVLSGSDFFGPTGYLAMLLGMNVPYDGNAAQGGDLTSQLRLIKKKNLMMGAFNSPASEWRAI